jgi:hypothetical protein
VVHQAVAEGVRRGLFGVRVGEQVYLYQEVPDEVLKSPTAVLIPPGTTPPQPQSSNQAGPVILRVRTSANLLYSLLKAAEQLRRLSEASVLLEVHDPTGKIDSLRTELEKLLKDYGCSVEWDPAG